MHVCIKEKRNENKQFFKVSEVPRNGDSSTHPAVLPSKSDLKDKESESVASRSGLREPGKQFSILDGSPCCERGRRAAEVKVGRISAPPCPSGFFLGLESHIACPVSCS